MNLNFRISYTLYYFLLLIIGFDKFLGNLEYPLFDLGGRGWLSVELLYFNDYFSKLLGTLLSWPYYYYSSSGFTENKCKFLCVEDVDNFCWCRWNGD